ncbi:PIN domain-containing protein [Candidatus Woesearchaeota archaeon]|nr:PIN domain-containing protein [Candidatus Woesearchaeota archaeon]
MSYKYVIDASAWFEYLYATQKGLKIKPLIEGEEIATSLIAVGELADKFARINHGFDIMLRFIQRRSALIGISVPLLLAAAGLKKEMRNKRPKFSMADGVHLATALQEGAVLVTSDADFSGMENVMIV